MAAKFLWVSRVSAHPKVTWLQVTPLHHCEAAARDLLLPQQDGRNPQACMQAQGRQEHLASGGASGGLWRAVNRSPHTWAWVRLHWAGPNLDSTDQTSPAGVQRRGLIWSSSPVRTKQPGREAWDCQLPISCGPLGSANSCVYSKFFSPRTLVIQSLQRNLHLHAFLYREVIPRVGSDGTTIPRSHSANQRIPRLVTLWGRKAGDGCQEPKANSTAF